MTDNTHIDKELLVRISRSDEKAFAILFSRYYEKLFHYIQRFIKSNQVAEEIVMDVFLKIWQGRDIILQIEKFDSFLFRIAHNKSIDFLRAVARDSQFQDLLLDIVQLPNNVQADSFTLVHEYESKIREAVSLLSPRRKKVYQLSREEDMTHDQIAHVMHISKYTVNNHIVESRSFIRNYLSKNCDIAFMLLIILNIIH